VYATVAQAKAQGAQGTDAEITTAILAAERRIDRYTGERWAPTDMALVAAVSGDRVTALLHRRVNTVSAVRVVGASTDLPTTAYRVLSSAVQGQQDAIVLGGQGLGDALIAGAEPWAGGWASFLDRQVGATGQVQVTGVFGHTDPPPEIELGAAILAAHLTTLGTGSQATEPAPDTDDEGNAVSITVTPQPALQRLTRTTGYGAVDSLLWPLVRQRVRLA